MCVGQTLAAQFACNHHTSSLFEQKVFWISVVKVHTHLSTCSSLRHGQVAYLKRGFYWHSNQLQEMQLITTQMRCPLVVLEFYFAKIGTWTCIPWPCTFTSWPCTFTSRPCTCTHARRLATRVGIPTSELVLHMLLWRRVETHLEFFTISCERYTENAVTLSE